MIYFILPIGLAVWFGLALYLFEDYTVVKRYRKRG